jgi:hypothetical protein
MFQVSKRSLLRQLMGGAASSGDALAQVAATLLFPVNFLVVSVVRFTFAASVHSSLPSQRGAAALKNHPDAARNMLVTW